jgi:hypothetical protein
MLSEESPSVLAERVPTSRLACARRGARRSFLLFTLLFGGFLTSDRTIWCKCTCGSGLHKAARCMVSGRRSLQPVHHPAAEQHKRAVDRRLSSGVARSLCSVCELLLFLPRTIAKIRSTTSSTVCSRSARCFVLGTGKRQGGLGGYYCNTKPRLGRRDRPISQLRILYSAVRLSSIVQLGTQPTRGHVRPRARGTCS